MSLTENRGPACEFDGLQRRSYNLYKHMLHQYKLMSFFSVIGDSDPRIGISDGVNVNRFFIADTGNYGRTAPCGIDEGSHEDNRVTTRRVSSQFTFLFSPFYKYGACSSAQDGGYLNVGTFNKQVDPTNGLSLLIQRGDALEQYQFNYFLIEIL